MPLEFKVRERRFNKLLADMEDMPNFMAKQVQPEGMKAAAEVVVKEARRLVPVDTGALKRSIEYEVIPATIRTIKGRRRFRNADAIVRAGNHDVLYAAYVEYGTIFARAQPYLRPALRNTRAQQRRAAARAMRRAFRRLRRSAGLRG